MINRIYLEKLNELLKYFPVVAVIGARQVGKTYLVTKLLKEQRKYYNLDDLTTLALAKNNPELLLDQEQPITIDEIQRMPSLMIEIKKRVDENRTEGKFLITGSANIEFIPKIQETLAGRIAFLEIFPITFYEQNNSKENPGLVRIIKENQISGSIVPKHNLNFIDELLLGTYPELVEKKSLFFSQNWYEGYIKSYLERDVRDLINIHSLIDYQKVLTLTSARVANLYSLTDLSQDIGINLTTIKRYLNLLMISYQFYELPPFFRNINKRLVKSSKIYSLDSGLSAYLTGLKSIMEIEKMGKLGNLIENRIITEIKALLSVFLNNCKMSFYRSHGGGEIDLILEYQNFLIPIEIKSSSNVINFNTKTLENFMEEHKIQVPFALVIYFGKQILEIKPGIFLVPWESLLI